MQSSLESSSALPHESKRKTYHRLSLRTKIEDSDTNVSNTSKKHIQGDPAFGRYE